MSTFEIQSYIFIIVLVFHQAKASQVLNSIFKLEACSSSSPDPQYFTTSSRDSCSLLCRHECIGFVKYEEKLSGEKRCATIDDVCHLPPDMKIDCYNFKEHKISFYLKTNNKDNKSDTNTYNNNKCSFSPNNPDWKISIDNDWLVPQLIQNTDWKIVQVRSSASVSFHRRWLHYQHGFGSLSGNFWLGLEKIHFFCSRECKMRFKFKYKRKDYFAYYIVSVSGASDNYRLRIQKNTFNGNVQDSFDSKNRGHNGMEFTTWDKDNDINEDKNCAVAYKGGWWYSDCHNVNFNGLWGATKSSGLKWLDITGRDGSATYTEIAINNNYKII